MKLKMLSKSVLLAASFWSVSALANHIDPNSIKFNGTYCNSYGNSFYTIEFVIDDVPSFSGTVQPYALVAIDYTLKLSTGANVKGTIPLYYQYDSNYNSATLLDFQKVSPEGYVRRVGTNQLAIKYFTAWPSSPFIPSGNITVNGEYSLRYQHGYTTTPVTSSTVISGQTPRDLSEILNIVNPVGNDWWHYNNRRYYMNWYYKSHNLPNEWAGTPWGV